MENTNTNKKIDYFSPDFVDSQLIQDPEKDRDKWSTIRNETILDLIDDIKIDNVFEFAGGSGLLAEMFINNHIEIKSYLFSDYSPMACELAQDYLEKFSIIDIKKYDIIKDLDIIAWENFDLVVCTSMEHFPKGVDIDILNHIQQGTHILLGLSTFPACTHTHLYSSTKYVSERFKDYIDIKKIMLYQTGFEQILLYGEKK